MRHIDIDLNGCRVVRRDGVILVPLPRAAWKPTHQPCRCRYCQGADSYYDTLAIAPTKDKKRADTTWMPRIYTGKRRTERWHAS